MWQLQLLPALGHNCPLEAGWGGAQGFQTHEAALEAPEAGEGAGLRLAGGLLGSAGCGAGQCAAHESLSGVGGLGQRRTEVEVSACFGDVGSGG